MMEELWKIIKLKDVCNPFYYLMICFINSVVILLYMLADNINSAMDKTEVKYDLSNRNM